MKVKEEESLSFSSCLFADLVLFLDDEAVSREDVIVKLLQAVGKREPIVGKAQKKFYKEMIQREEIVTTAIGEGLAFPHGRTSFGTHFFVAIGVHRAGVEWNSIDSLPAHLIFLVLGPYHKRGVYLNLLSHLTFIFKSEENKSSVLFSTSQDEIIELLNQFDKKL